MDILDQFLGPYRRRQFAMSIVAGLRKAGEPLEFRYDPREFRLVSAGDEGYVINLGNTYREYLAVPRAERSTVLSRIFRSWIEGRKGIPDDFGDASHDLLPGVRSRASFEIFKLQARVDGGPEFDWPYRIVGENYGAGLLYDLPHAMSQIDGRQLERWGVSLDEAMDLAIANLEGLSGQGLQPMAPGVWRSPWHDNYDASRILLTDFIRAHDVEGDPVVLIPNRDTLILTGSEDPAGLRMLAAAGVDALVRPRPLHAFPLRLEFGTWTPYIPPEDSPAYSPIKSLILVHQAQAYSAQQELLQAINSANGDEVFVASFSVLVDRDGEMRWSYSVWSQGFDTSLPHTDLVCFSGLEPPEGESRFGPVTWEQMLEIVGDQLEPEDAYPERFRVRAFPKAEQIKRLRAAGVKLS